MKSIYQNIRKYAAKGVIALAAFSPVFMSCSDILETDSELVIVDPKLDQKTDSMSYILGIMKAVQLATDQMVLAGEMRGDLVRTNQYTETALRELANFSAGTDNKYDSAYVYYRIINNCNYYIAHRDTTLNTSGNAVAMKEYVQAKSVRAWTYLQLARNYGEVPFYTTPLTTIQEANSIANMGRRDIKGIAEEMVNDLRPYSYLYSKDPGNETKVPTYGEFNAGDLNDGTGRKFDSRRIMFPVDLVIGDLCLEAERYEEALRHYVAYLGENLDLVNGYIPDFYVSPRMYYPYRDNLLPNIPEYSRSRIDWSNSFSSTPMSAITYIPMASNSLWGTTTDLPRLFGYNLYSTSPITYSNSFNTVVVRNSETQDRYVLEREIEPSDEYNRLSASQIFFYNVNASALNPSYTFIGDQRRYASVESVVMTDSTYQHVSKFDFGNVIVYRTSTIWLRIAEALNRLGYPDAAFAILKDGINNVTVNIDNTSYLSPKTIEYLRNNVITPKYENVFDLTERGIHSFGCCDTDGGYSYYEYPTIVRLKFDELRDRMGIVNGETLNDTINAVEDLICDEYALELAFEGHRFGDLCRLARHKNADSPYGSNFGSRWLADKLAFKHPQVDLTDEKQWYLPLSLQ